MGRRQAPEKKRRVHSSPEPVRAALPSSPVHNVSASGSQNNAERDHELEPLSGNLPNVILLSMLEQLEAKLDNLQNTLKDIPSRVAVLMEQIWLTKGQYHLENGGASLEMVSPVTVGDCSFSKFPPTPLSVMAREGNQYLQPTPPHGCEPEQSQCLQPMSLDGCELQEDCTVSRCSPPDVLVIPGEPSLRLLPVIDGGQEPQEDQCTQLEPEEHVKKEQLYADSWNPQQRFCLQPPFYERREPQQNHFRQPVLPDGKGPDEHIKQELLWIDGDGPQLNHCRQPAFEECQSLQNNTWLEQVLSDENEPHQNCKTEPMHPEDCGQYCDLQQPCTDAQGASVSSSFLEQNTAGTDGTISTDPLERGNMESDVLLFKSIPAQQSQTECMNGKEKHTASGGRKNFAHKINERKHQRIHRSERFNNKTVLLRHKRMRTDLRTYSCAECKKMFTGKTHLLLHEKTHTELRQYPNTEHEKSLDDEATLIHQEVSHRGERPFHCNICDKSFTQKGNLLQHQRIHTGEKPHHCNVCSMRFTRKANLIRHHTIHTGWRPYYCSVCGKSFNRKERLVGHQRIHTEEGHAASQDMKIVLNKRWLLSNIK